MENQETEKKITTITKKDYEDAALARAFFVDTLKTYKLYRENYQLFGPVYIACDRCFDIRPRWVTNCSFFHNNSNDITLCSECHEVALSEEEKKDFDIMLMHKRPNTGLYEF